MLYFVDRGWIPHDEGTLAHSAERVLGGEMPHRDFADPYTGGLSYLNAVAFKVFGVHLLAIRYLLFAAFVTWVPLLYYAATRLASPPVAGAVTLLAVFWSVPNYPAAMPSWYNLFFATGGVAALLAYIDSGKRHWLVVAGLAGGFSVLVKTTGVLFVGAGLLFLLYHESRPTNPLREYRKSGTLFNLAAGFPLVIAAIALVAISMSRGRWVDVYQFAVPGFAMVGTVAWELFRAPGPSVTAARLTVGAVVPYMLGVAIPLGAFAAYYAIAEALPELVRGVVSLPTRRFDHASVSPALPYAVIPMALAAFVAIDTKGKAPRVALFQHAIAIAVVAVTLVPKLALELEPMVWQSLAEATPIVVALLAIITVRNSIRGGVDPKQQSRSVLVGCVAAFCSLIQYPFAAPIYFSYSLPLLLLAVVALAQSTTLVRKRALQGLTCVYLLYGALFITPMQVQGLLGPVSRDDVALLKLPRAGLRVGREDAEQYPKAVELLRTHTTSGVTYAGPDAPEVYFLAQLRNPTPAIFDFLVPDTLFHQHLVQSLDSYGINAVALRRRVVHSAPLEPEIQAALETKFPSAHEAGRFTIRWKP